MIGGAYKRYMRLIESMIEKGWNVFHISPSGFNNIKNSSLIHYSTYDIPIKPRFLVFYPQALFVLLCLKRKNVKIDAIITFSSLENLIALAYKNIDKDVKVILSVRGDSLSGYLITYNSFFIKKLFIYLFLIIDKLSLLNSDLIIFVSNYNKEINIKRLKPKNTQNFIVVHNDMHLQIFPEEEGQCIEIPQNTVLIGFIGNLFSKGKGIEQLIYAYLKIRINIPNSQLIIVGDGPDKDFLHSLVTSLHLENNIIFTGYQKNVKKYIEKCSLIVLPSLHEGLSNVLLEAIYLDIPVIGSNVGGNPEILKYEDLMFDPTDNDKLCEKILLILTNDDYYQKIKSLIRERRQHFNFDWSENMIEKINNCIEKGNCINHKFDNK